MSMTFKEFQKRSRFNQSEVEAFARGRLLSGAPMSLPALSDFLLLAFHEIAEISWNENSRTGRIVAVRYNHVDDWYYACHFLGDPVMPGCWGIDAIWQCLKFFAAWRGLGGCDKELGMEDVRFSGQVRPYDQKIVYAADIVSIEESEGEFLLSARATVSVDGTDIYSMGSAQIGSSFWEKPKDSVSPPPAFEKIPPFERSLSYGEFTARKRFSKEEVIALSQGRLVKNPPVEMGLLPSSLMMGIDSVELISADQESGTGKILASQENSGLEWFYPMSRSIKPPAFSIDSIWQLLGLFLTWVGAAGTGRALGFERVEVFDRISPEDQRISYEVDILKISRPAMASDVFVKGNGRVFAGERLILSCLGAHVGCHKNIRYPDYPLRSEMAFGGNLKTRQVERAGP